MFQRGLIVGTDGFGAQATATISKFPSEKAMIYAAEIPDWTDHKSRWQFLAHGSAELAGA
jgi:hypothetical protein